MSNNDSMDVSGNGDEPTASTSSSTQLTQSQIAQKTWELSNKIQGLKMKFSIFSNQNIYLTKK
jgi:hypothetical protein